LTVAKSLLPRASPNLRVLASRPITLGYSLENREGQSKWAFPRLKEGKAYSTGENIWHAIRESFFN
jgi:hypothetical protein